MLNSPLTVAWISDFPLEWLPDLPAPLRELPRRHPSTWQPTLLSELSKDPNVRVHVIVLRGRIKRSLSFKLGGVEFHVLKAAPLARVLSLFWVDTLLIRRVCYRIMPDVVHAWGSEKGALLIASRLARPYVATIQGLFNWYKQVVPIAPYERIVERLECISLPRARIVTCESTFTAQFIRNRHPHLDVRRVEHAPAWLFHQVTRRPQSSPVHFISVGRLDYRKGVDLLLLALNQLARQIEFKLTVVGGANAKLLAGLRSAISQDLWRRIEFRRDLTPSEVAKELEIPTMMLMPTRADTGPMAVKEAVVAGVPVVASNVGGIPDYVLPGKNGLLFSVNDLPGFIQAIRAACEHPLFGKGLVETSTLGQMRRLLSPSAMTNGFVETYLAVLQKQTG